MEDNNEVRLEDLFNESTCRTLSILEIHHEHGVRDASGDTEIVQRLEHTGKDTVSVQFNGAHPVLEIEGFEHTCSVENDDGTVTELYKTIEDNKKMSVLIETYRGIEIYFRPDDNEFYADIDYGQQEYSRFAPSGITRVESSQIDGIRRSINERHDARVCFEWSKYGLTTHRMLPSSTVHNDNQISHHAYTAEVDAAVRSKEEAEKEWQAEQERVRAEGKKITEMLEPFDYETAPSYYPPLDRT